VFVNTITYWLAILFSLLILISSILTILDIARNNTAKTLKIIGLAVTVFSGVFTFISSYSASIFWQIQQPGVIVLTMVRILLESHGIPFVFLVVITTNLLWIVYHLR
jgi:hypothetical protein